MSEVGIVASLCEGEKKKKSKYHLSARRDITVNSRGEAGNWRFICLPLLSRFSVGSPPYIKAMIIFLTIPASVRASGKKETLCQMHCREAISRMVMNSVNPSARPTPFSHPIPSRGDEREGPQISFGTRKTFISLSADHFWLVPLSEAEFDVIRKRHGHFYHLVIRRVSFMLICLNVCGHLCSSYDLKSWGTSNTCLHWCNANVEIACET